MNTSMCEGCGAIGISCCIASKERLETANTLADLVRRQMEKIQDLQFQLDRVSDAIR